MHQLRLEPDPAKLLQAEMMRHLLIGVLQRVILGPANCLRVTMAARHTGLPSLHRAAAAVARQHFPLCALEDPDGLAAASRPLLAHLLQQASRQASTCRAPDVWALLRVPVECSADRALLPAISCCLSGMHLLSRCCY